MSTLFSRVEMDYPESDGQPMGETDWHIDAIIRLRDMLRLRYRGKKVYVGSDLLVYYVEGEPRRFVVPDVFVVLDCEPKDRRTFKVWEEKRTPDIVFEITSRSTAREDEVFKPKFYEQIGVKELFLFDPTGDYLVPQLQGFRLVDRGLAAMSRQNDQLHSEVLGVDISIHDTKLQLIDSRTGNEVLTGEEFERQAKEVERQAREFERQAKEVERQAKEFERQARMVAEAKSERLQAELDQLRKQ